MNKLTKKLVVIGLLITGLVFLLPSIAKATNFTQTYQSSAPLGVGTVVSLAGGDNKIEKTTADNDSKTVGVVAPSNDSSIIDLQAKNTNLKVILNGQALIFVTDLDGEIKAGDSLIISPLSGVAMKDVQGYKASKYIGIAQQDFSASSDTSKKVSVTLTNGTKKDVNIRQITANIQISERPPEKSTKAKSFLTTIGERIVGHPVSTFRVAVALILVLSAMTITGLMLNASIRGAFVSIGRNPLARSSIIANLMKILIIALLVFQIGLVAGYLVLSL